MNGSKGWTGPLAGASTWHELQAAYDSTQVMKRVDNLDVQRVTLDTHIVCRLDLLGVRTLVIQRRSVTFSDCGCIAIEMAYYRVDTGLVLYFPPTLDSLSHIY